MKEITKTFKVYNILELKDVNKKAYDKIIDKEKDSMIEDNFNFSCADDMLYELANVYGLRSANEKNFDLEYSLSYCQGDGVSFATNELMWLDCNGHLDLKSSFAKVLKEKLSDIEFSWIELYYKSGKYFNLVRQSSMYSHSYTCSIDYEIYENDVLDDDIVDLINNEVLQKAEKIIYDKYLEICSELEKLGYSYYDVSENDIEEFLFDNDAEYLEDGTSYYE